MREGERGREGEDTGKGKREREPLIMFSAHFFGPLLFTCVGAFMGAERGDGERVISPVEKLAGQVSPRNENISETFFLDAF